MNVLDEIQLSQAEDPVDRFCRANRLQGKLKGTAGVGKHSKGFGEALLFVGYERFSVELIYVPPPKKYSSKLLQHI